MSSFLEISYWSRILGIEVEKEVMKIIW